MAGVKTIATHSGGWEMRGRNFIGVTTFSACFPGCVKVEWVQETPRPLTVNRAVLGGATRKESWWGMTFDLKEMCRCVYLQDAGRQKEDERKHNKCACQCLHRIIVVLDGWPVAKLPTGNWPSHTRTVSWFVSSPIVLESFDKHVHRLSLGNRASSTWSFIGKSELTVANCSF